MRTFAVICGRSPLLLDDSAVHFTTFFALSRDCLGVWPAIQLVVVDILDDTVG